jgi:phosphoglycerate dehydrogenase-like enzyme
MQKGLWKDDRYLGAELAGSTIGIIGYGNVAILVIRKLQAFDIRKILVFSESKKHEKPEFSNVDFTDLSTLLKESDIVSIHKTLTSQSGGLIGEHELSIMRNAAYLVNTSRGALIQEAALIRALKEEWIAGAALDVFEEEPLDPHNPLLWLDNVVLTPHIGGISLKARIEGVTTVANNIRDILQGKKPDLHYIVNPEVFG